MEQVGSGSFRREVWVHEFVDVGDALREGVVLHCGVVSDEVTTLGLVQGVDINLGAKDGPRDKGAKVRIAIEEILFNLDSRSFPRP